MVLVGAASYLPARARALSAEVKLHDFKPEHWQMMRQRHKNGDDQILQLLNYATTMKDSYDDLNFTPPYLARITARTLIVCGDRDEILPVEIFFEMHRVIAGSRLWVVPNGAHAPVFGEMAIGFVQTALQFLATEGPVAPMGTIRGDLWEGFAEAAKRVNGKSGM
jgi:pimeloyl-ACP methyl ester carboxylesterase